MKKYRKDFEAIPEECDYLAPDGSEIRLLSQVAAGEIAHCTLPPYAKSRATAHRSVQEIWHFLEGEGELWRKTGDASNTVRVSKGSSVTIGVGVHFQFRNLGPTPLTFIIVTIPTWPGPSEAIFVKGIW